MKSVLSILLLVITSIINHSIFAQQDSTLLHTDSAIQKQEQKSTLIKAMADSINKVDSLFQLSLEKELNQLRSKVLKKMRIQ